MNTRSDKYYDEPVKIGSRTARNSDLYKDIKKEELDNFEVKSNATVIGNNRGSIDVEKIKSILDTHYNDLPKRRSIRIEEETKEEEIKPIFETKEYDINVILDKARENKKDDYNEERNKKLHDTQFDILNKLNIDPKDYIEDYDGDSDLSEQRDQSAAKKLQELINTVTLNEKDIKEKHDIQETSEINNEIKEESNEKTDPLDILEDLKGSENTVALEGLQEKTENLIKQMEETTSLDKSFFTKSNSFKKTDFEDFKDIEEKSNPIFKVVIILLVVAFIIGIIILIKSYILA